MLEQLPDLQKLLIFGALILFMVGMSTLRPRRRRWKPGSRRPWPQLARNVVSLDRRRVSTDPADQLRTVMTATFEKKRLMSRSEARFFYFAETAIARRKLTWRVMAQVSLGEVLSSPDPEAHRAINAKRVDMLIVSSAGEPLAAIEYQGSGHYQGTAPARDAVKKEALRRAGVRYIEVTPDHGAEDVAREIERLDVAMKQQARQAASS